MPTNRCSGCAIDDMIRIKEAVEKKLINRLPEDVRQPLQEAKRNIRQALRGLVNHIVEDGNEPSPTAMKKVPVE